MTVLRPLGFIGLDVQLTHTAAELPCCYPGSWHALTPELTPLADVPYRSVFTTALSGKALICLHLTGESISKN